MSLRLNIFLCIFAFLGHILFADSGVPHPDPKNDSLIQISGWPFYLENIQIGSPLSDYGSHFGIKASVDNDGDNYPRFDSPPRIDAKNFLNMAHYLAITSFYGQVDQSYFWFKEPPPGNIEHLNPATSRSIQFFPYGWREEAGDSTISAIGEVVTIDTDTFLFLIRVKNIFSDVITLTPILTILKDSDPQREGTNVYGSSFGGCNSYERDTINNVVSLICNGKRVSKDIHFVRAVKSSETISSVTLTSGDNYKIDIELGSLSLNQNEEKEIFVVIGYSAEGDNTLSDAKNLAIAGWTKIQLAGGPTEIINNIANEWNNFFTNLPLPHTSDRRFIQLYQMSATALRMNLYKKRNRMPADCSVPGKAHFNFFWAWDTPFHTLGHSEWDVQMAKDNLRTQFSGQDESGKIIMVIDDNLTSNFWLDLTQPPVQGWAIKEIAERDGFKDIDWLLLMYEASRRYLNFWEQNRDSDKDGLYEFASGLETGWDDTPRFHCGPVTNICVAKTDTIDSLDLNAWIYQYYYAMSEIAYKLGKNTDSEELKKKAEDISKDIENLLWDEESGAFFDRELVNDKHQFIRVLTPAMFLPLSVGAIRDVNKARRVIEEHLLNPNEFWGTYPIPTVAYNDEKFDHQDDGYYWQGQIWLVTSYSALKALYRYGYENQAEELKKRTLEMIYNADPGGIHETYDALTGRIGWGAGSNGYIRGVGEPSVFQFGWSSAFTMEMILERYQRERFLMPSDKKITGFVKEIRRVKDNSRYITIESDTYEVPRLTLESSGDSPIIDSKSIYLKLEDPYNAFCTTGCLQPFFGMDYPFKLSLYFPAKVGEVKEDGTIDWLNLKSNSSGNFFPAKPTVESTGIKYYIIIPQEDGCGCNVNSNNASGYLLIGILLVFILIKFPLRIS